MAVVALDGEGRVALVRQWRLPADAALLEIPAGGLDVADDGTKEDPDLAAPRELEEETGLRAGTWRKLGTFYTAPGFTDELMHLYLATHLTSVHADGRLAADEDEALILSWLPWPEAVAAAESGAIRDAKSIVGLFWLARILDSRADGAADGHVAVGDTAVGHYRMSTREVVGATVAMARRSRWMTILGLGVAAISIIPVLNGDLASWFGLLFGLSMATGLFVAPFAWYQARKRPDLVGAEVTVTADATGLTFESVMGAGKNGWATYRKVQDTGDVFVLDTQMGAAQVVPKRAFSATDLATFYRILDVAGLLSEQRRR